MKFLLASLAVVVGMLVMVVACQMDHIEELEERLYRLERQVHFLGRDVDGNEVWGAQVMEVALPKDPVHEYTQEP